MRLARPACLLLIVAILVPAASQGFDPRHIDIIDYRLGMTEAEITAVVERQGFLDAAYHRDDTPCPTDPARRCLSAIEARTKDGTLVLTFSIEARVERITYSLDVRKPKAAARLERSVLDRYGPPMTTGPLKSGPMTTGPMTTGPSTTGPMTTGPLTWCLRRNEDGLCPPDAPRLTFDAGHGHVAVLTLTLR